MALTLTEGHRGVVGARRVWRGKVTFDSSYPTGGEAIAIGDFGFNLDIETVQIIANAGSETVQWDQANSKIMVHTADGTEATNASDQSAVTATVVAYGR